MTIFKRILTGTTTYRDVPIVWALIVAALIAGILIGLFLQW